MLRLGDTPIKTNIIRILLKKASGAAPAGSFGVRDKLGFAIREVYAGTLDANGTLADAMVHTPDGKKQTEIVTSSTDPWHRATDSDPDIEPPGIDRLIASGLARGRPILMPAGLSYDTPDNVAAEVRFLKARGYEVRQMELGEEPDGQNISPEHYGALFVQFADAIRKENPGLVLGKPDHPERGGWLDSIPDNDGKTSWMGRFPVLPEKPRSNGRFRLLLFRMVSFRRSVPGKSRRNSWCIIPRSSPRPFSALSRMACRKDIPWSSRSMATPSFAGQAERSNSPRPCSMRRSCCSGSCLASRRPIFMA